MKELAKLLMLGGGLLLVGGVLVYFFGDRLKWFGCLPGDIRVEKPGFSFYMPLTSMLLLSAVLSLLIWVFRKMF